MQAKTIKSLYVGQDLQKVTENPYNFALPTLANITYCITYKDVGGDMDVSI